MAMIGDMVKRARALGGLSVKAGVLGGATYEDGTLVAEVAFWNEYGTSRTPARPFLRTAVWDNGDAWRGLLSRAAERYMLGAGTLADVVTITGGQMEADIKESIKGGEFEPISPVTAAARHFRKRKDMERGAAYWAALRAVRDGTADTSDNAPLRDTHTLYNAISYAEGV